MGMNFKVRAAGPADRLSAFTSTKTGHETAFWTVSPRWPFDHRKCRSPMAKVLETGSEDRDLCAASTRSLSLSVKKPFINMNWLVFMRQNLFFLFNKIWILAQGDCWSHFSERQKKKRKSKSSWRMMRYYWVTWNETKQLGGTFEWYR